MKRLLIFLMFAVFALASSAQSSGGMVRRAPIQKRVQVKPKAHGTQRKKAGISKAEAHKYVAEWVEAMNDELDLPDYIDDDDNIYMYEAVLEKYGGKYYVFMSYLYKEIDITNIDKKEYKGYIIHKYKQQTELVRYLKIANIGLLFKLNDSRGNSVYVYIEANEL